MSNQHSSESPEFTTGDVIRLLHHLDGHLGLAVHRGEGSTEHWKRETANYVTDIRKAIAALIAGQEFHRERRDIFVDCLSDYDGQESIHEKHRSW